MLAQRRQTAAAAAGESDGFGAMEQADGAVADEARGGGGSDGRAEGAAAAFDQGDSLVKELEAAFGQDYEAADDDFDEEVRPS